MNRAIALIGRFSRLGLRQQRVLCEAWLRCMGAAVALRIAPARTVRRALQRRRVGPSSTATWDRAAELGAFVAIASRYAPAADTCLVRSLALHRMLCNDNLDSHLQIGVSTSAGPFDAHAWVEHGGRPVQQSDDLVLRFEPLAPARGTEGL